MMFRMEKGFREWNQISGCQGLGLGAWGNTTQWKYSLSRSWRRVMAEYFAKSLQQCILKGWILLNVNCTLINKKVNEKDCSGLNDILSMTEPTTMPSTQWVHHRDFFHLFKPKIRGSFLKCRDPGLIPALFHLLALQPWTIRLNFLKFLTQKMEIKWWFCKVGVCET